MGECIMAAIFRVHICLLILGYGTISNMDAHYSQ